MEKKTYYVSVQAGTVLPNEGDAAFEFEIQATEEEVEQLIELFNSKRETEEDTFIRAPVPAIPYHQDEENDNYDAVLKQIYDKIYELGTEETKAAIAAMNLNAPEKTPI